MNKQSNLTRIICKIGIFSAIGYILDEFQSIFFKGVFINGGSIGFAMIVVLIIGYRRGFLSALLTGLLMGLFDLATGAYIIHPAQLVLDYLLPYAAVALGLLVKPLFNNNKKLELCSIIICSIIGGLAKLTCHYLSGILFWTNASSFAWGLTYLSPHIYSLIYNVAFIGPSIILTTALLVLLYKKGKRILKVEDYQIEEKEPTPSSKKELASSTITLGLGLLLFIYFLIKYIQSFSIAEDSTTIEYYFSQDSMVIFILGFVMIIIGVLGMINNIKNRSTITLTITTYIMLSIASLIYSLSKLIKTAIKNSDCSLYILWFVLSTIILILFITIFQISKKKKN